MYSQNKTLSIVANSIHGLQEKAIVSIDLSKMLLDHPDFAFCCTIFSLYHVKDISIRVVPIDRTVKSQSVYGMCFSPALPIGIPPKKIDDFKSMIRRVFTKNNEELSFMYDPNVTKKLCIDSKTNIPVFDELFLSTYFGEFDVFISISFNITFI